MMDFKTKKFAIITASLLALSITSCSCGHPLKITPIQKDDKKLACKDIILEINEAEHYRSEAQKSKLIGVGEIFAPVCWINGYVDGEQAMKAANARIQYLGNIYDLLDCSGKAREANAKQSQESKMERSQDENLDSKPTPNQLQQTNEDKESYLKYLHEHKDEKGNKYRHSHPNNGPHQHVGDMK